MTDPYSRYRARVPQADCRYCKGTGSIRVHYGEGSLIKAKLVKCHHIVGDPFDTEDREEYL